ncbi:hypothetical protein ACNR9V_15240 [Parageobacillus thermoglucosidasius]|uniref:hypothetical protein n=1 Tax=Parageobacillus thermoglucosidasius TaxID=1426 RepID=UPI000B1C198A
MQLWTGCSSQPVRPLARAPCGEKMKTGIIHINGQLINVEENVPFGGELSLLW